MFNVQLKHLKLGFIRYIGKRPLQVVVHLFQIGGELSLHNSEGMASEFALFNSLINRADGDFEKVAALSWDLEGSSVFGMYLLFREEISNKSEVCSSH